MGFKTTLNAFLFVLNAITGSAQINQYQVGAAKVADNKLYMTDSSGGDINPISEIHQETGTMLANDIENVLSSSLEILTGIISYSLKTI